MQEPDVGFWAAALAMLVQLAASTLRMSTPLVFAALGGYLSERSGVVNIALEGFMLLGAFAAAAASVATGSPWAGLGAAVIGGGAVALVYGLFVIRLRSDQIVAGTASNMLALGTAPFLCKILYDSTGSSPSIPLADRFAHFPIFLAWALVLALHFWTSLSPGGLWLRFAGEHPKALDSAGVSVRRVRWLAVAASGALAGLGGATLSICLSSAYSRNMTAGRGFMALAALIYGKWRPVPAAAACLLFGFADAVQIRLQGVVLWGRDPVPVQFIQILPYGVTIVVLAGWVGQSRAPRALGVPFEKGER